MPDEQKVTFKPYIPDNVTMTEFTAKSIILGVVLGLVFSAVTVYLGLRVGLTIAVNIPISIIAMAFFALFYRLGVSDKATILEINTVQTTGAAGESIAAGVIFTLPAMIFLGYTLDISRVFVVALAGGLLGVCFLIPLRRYLIEREHGVLPYPEGIACAEVIKSGERGGVHAAKVFWGAAFGFVYKFFMGGFKLWEEIPAWRPKWYSGSTITAEVSPELLGVGYIIGPRTACIMVAGGFVSWVLLIPMIKYFGAAIPITYASEGQMVTTTLGQLTNFKIIWNNYIRYIGAGAVVAGGFINLIKAMPTIIGSFKDSLADLKLTRESGETKKGRTTLDLPITLVGLGALVAFVVVFLLLTLVINPGHIFGNLIAAILVIIFGFFFATVSSRLVGEIGVSSNPTSGMTIATLMATCLIFLVVGWTGGFYAAVALSIGAVVCICASNAGNVAQSLKTGFLLGCTPKKQEYGYIIGALTSILVVGFTVLAVNAWFTDTRAITDPSFSVPKEAQYERHMTYEGRQVKVYTIVGTGEKYLVDESDGTIIRQEVGIGSEKLPAPQARLMATVIDGVLNQRLHWAFILMGICLTLAVELCGVRGLPFAVGVYLPLSTSAPIFIGGLIRWMIDKFMHKGKKAESESGPGMLFSSGLIAGGAIAGLVIAAVAGFDLEEAVGIGPSLLGHLTESKYFALAAFIALCALLVIMSRGKSAVEETEGEKD